MSFTNLKRKEIRRNLELVNDKKTGNGLQMRKTTLKPIPKTKLILCCKQVKTTATIKK